MAKTRFGERLVELLKAADNMTVYALAKKSGVTAPALAKITKGLSDPSWDTALKIARALGVSVKVFDAPVAPES